MADIALANIAAATAAGYKETVLDRGASFSPASLRFEVTLDKALVGEPTATGNQIRAFGQGANQAAAEAVALAALNFQRKARYGQDDSVTFKGPRGQTMTKDLN